MKMNNKSLLKELPAVQDFLTDSELGKYEIDSIYLKKIVQRELQHFRDEILAGTITGNLTREVLREKIVARVKGRTTGFILPRMRRVINGTGIILHTNMGRAPLPVQAKEHLSEIIENYCNLEIELDSGKRGNRIELVEEIICLITGAEAAVVVNNNAAAVLLTLNSLCKRKEVPVSRGELVEIGGSFRMPEVMKVSQAKMVEVGATNKTHLADYREAITGRTAAILKVHTSNYRILGFAETVPIADLVELAHSHALPVIYDMGSGVMEDLQNWGFPHEPVAREYVEAGADVITFSGDKVLGGPQSGIIIGKKKYVQKIRKNHLLRALRCDKVTYALLDATLRLYLTPSKIPENLPVAHMLTITQQELRKRGEKILAEIQDLPIEIAVIDTYSQMGSGALPLEKIPSVALRLKPNKMSVSRLARLLRLSDPAVVGYIEDDHFMLNLRTVRQDELQQTAQVLRRVLG
ncbi:MAG TPA: L-seryl-tRNA(Sec) selenium transferase [Caldithrix sp.]|nr:L-seryl-tRNA(Sec) selenium transferase [Caldithrix sp.]